MNKIGLPGVWKLVKYSTILEKSNEEIPLFGGKAIGYIIYTPEGLVSVHIMPSDRALPNSKLQEKIESAENYGGYIVRYEISGSTLLYYPEISNFISYIHIHQSNEFKIIENRIYLEYSHPLEEYPLFPEKPVMAHSVVVWKKIR